MATPTHRFRGMVLSIARLGVIICAPCFIIAQSAGNWTQKSPQNSPPAPLFHAMAYDSIHSQTVMFGGCVGQFCVPSADSNDTWTWDGSNWTSKSPQNSPSARVAHAMAYDSAHGQVVLFGGVHGNNNFCDTWTWDGSNWTLESPQLSPSARDGHAMAYDSAHGQVVLFGGGSPSDTWTWDSSNWTQKFPLKSPPGRVAHAMAYDSAHGQVVLFGGGDGNNIFSDTWVWDGSNWTQKSPQNSPSGRVFHAMAYDSAHGQVVLFGGLDGKNIFGDTWIWDGSNWTLESPQHSPSARDGHAMAYDSAHGQVVLFGGALPSDTWTWNGGGATRPSLSAVISAASLEPGSISPGEIVSLFGAGMGPVSGVPFAVVNGKLPTTLGNATVTFNGVAAPLLYVSSVQINAIVPYEVASQAKANVVVQFNSATSAIFQTGVSDTAPAIFSQTQTGMGLGAILNQDFSLNGPNNPAPKGSVIAIFGTGEGQLLPAVSTGSLTPGVPPFPAPIAKVSVTIAGQPAQILYAGAAPTLISGLFQVNAVVPSDTGTGPQKVVLTIGDKSTIQQNVTVIAGSAIPGLQSLTLSSTSVTGGSSITGTVNLSTGAPSSGIQVQLSSSNPSVQVPPIVNVLPGQNSSSFTITTTAVTSTQTATITSKLGSTVQTATVTVNPPPSNPQPVITSLSPSSATAGSSPITLTINGSGFIGSSSVTFNGVSHAPSSANTNQLAITLSQFDLVTPGTFSVVVTNPQPGGGSSAPASFVVQNQVAPTLRSLAINGGTLIGGTVNLTAGTSTTGTVGLSGPAPSGGIQISLSSSNPSLQVPATVNVATGQNSANFTITTVAVSSAQAVTLTATLQAVQLSANLTVIPATPANPFQNSSFDIYGTLNISGQSVPVEVQTAALSDGTFGVLNNSGGSLINLAILFNKQSSASGNTLTYVGADPSSFFINTSTSEFYLSITSATLSITIPSPTVGATVTGTFKFTSSGTTLNGTITGSIRSVSGP
jgi:uncharacterized protein (TIGR03437 family)